MDWLNYHHLLYFWMVAKEGSITAAAKPLRLSHPTISGQIHRLEASLGQQLFRRQGRNLVLTDAGRLAYRYADEIFGLGQKLTQVLAGQSPSLAPLRVGVSDVLARSIVHRMLEPVFAMKEPVRVICRENRSLEGFMGELASQQIDVVLSDTPASAGSLARTFNHRLGDCGTAFFSTPKLARSLRRGFPHSLTGAPMVLPARDSTFRRALDAWFEGKKLLPRITAELDDAALAAVLGEKGVGVFAAPELIEPDLKRRYEIERVGRASEVRQSFFAITAERKVTHPAAVAIFEAARKRLFD